MTKKRVFILGAGFSVQAGLPLADELMPLLVKKAKLKDVEEFRTWFEAFRARLVASEGEKVNFEPSFDHCFDFAAFDIECLRMEQQLAHVSRRHGETPWKKAEDIKAWLSYIERVVPHVIWAGQKAGNLSKVGEFTEHLTEDDTVVTFNYDTLIEQALSDAGAAWNHGFSLETTGGVTVLKMHGSIDWLLLRRRPEAELEKFTKLFSKIDLNAPVKPTGAGNVSLDEDLGLLGDGSRPAREPEYDWELWRAKDAKVCGAMLDVDKCGLSNFEYHMGIVPPGRHKPLHRLVGSGETWHNAFKALKEAEEVYAVGFSMSAYDTMTRFHFASVMRARETKLSKVVVVDPNGCDLADRFKAVFGDALTVVAKRADEVVWVEVLSGGASA